MILIAVLSGPLAQASPAQGSAATASEPDDHDVFRAPAFGPANAQGGRARTAVFKVHPLVTVGGLILGSLSSSTLVMVPVELEYAVAPNFSISAMATPTFLAGGYTSGIGIGLNGALRGYFSGNAPEGFWMGAQLMTTLMSMTRGTSSSGLVSLDLQPQLGYQWVTEGGFTIGVGGGISLAALAGGQPSFTFQVPIGFAW
ncbi:MAG TPA: hypothetical protein VND93_22055 [Myxococcales bacterium]|nr:hypothetical protein [Myxococcales bacterium]